MSDYYELLGVPPTAAAAEIRRAYARLAKERHPDRYTDPVEKERAQSFFKDLTTAFNTLVNDARRQEYDQGRARPRPHAPEVAEYHAALGRALGRNPQTQREAIQCLEKASHLEPSNGGHFADLALLFHSQGLRLRAQKALETAQRLAPRDPRVAKLLAELGGSRS